MLNRTERLESKSLGHGWRCPDGLVPSGEHLVVNVPKAANDLVGSKVALQPFLAEAVAVNGLSHPHPVSELELHIAATKVVPASVDTLLVFYPKAG